MPSARTGGPPVTAPRRADGARISSNGAHAPQDGARRAGADARAIEVRRAAFERHLARVLPSAQVTPATLHEAMRYATLGPGKRVRPLLVLASCEAAGGRWRDALPAAAAVELVHAFSLVHDDLPAMDDDDYRRGRLTTHRKYGEAMGILAGDALLALAFESLAAVTPPARAAHATRILARATGSRELVGGQVLDVDAEGRPGISIAQVRAIHTRKTGALMGASMALGALCAGGTQRQVAAFDRLGRNLGIAFQIRDDLLNRESSLATLGKRGGTDAARGKATWPRAVGESRARRDTERLLRRVHDAAARMGPRARMLGALIDAIGAREH